MNDSLLDSRLVGLFYTLPVLGRGVYVTTFRVPCLTGHSDYEFQTKVASRGTACPLAPDEITATKGKVLQMLIRMAPKAPGVPNVLKWHFHN